MALIHASKYRPRIFPIAGLAVPAEIDRCQSIDPTATTNKEEVNELGRTDVVGYVDKSPTVTYRLSQLEYASIEFWQKLINSDTLGDAGQSGITQDSFKTPYCDYCAYLTDDSATFKGTLLYPAQRVSGFTITIGDPQATIERTFDMVGEKAQIWQGANKYYHCETKTCSSGSDNDWDLTAYAPAEDPNNTGVYMLRVVRITSLGVATELTTSEYTYSNSTKILSITTVSAGDRIDAYFTSAVAPSVMFTENDTDVPAISGESVSIYMYIPASGKPGSSDYLYRLQSITLDVKFDREDIREIGNDEVVARGVNDTTVTATLGRVLEGFTIEEVLAGKTADYGCIDVSDLSDEIAIIIKFFDDKTKANFKYGIKCTGMAPSDVKFGVNVKEYVKPEDTLTGKTFTISADTSVLGI